ncbi:MAG: rRNA pseudouridine synthase RluC [Pseudomonadota bacterium]|jgi:23S rRNA pseudouridine955/2504/2580 synthase
MNLIFFQLFIDLKHQYCQCWYHVPMNENVKLTASGASTVLVDQEFADQRIDNFLMSRLKGVPRSHVYRLLRTGQVRVNGGRIQASYRLKGGDAVRIPPHRHTDTVVPEDQPWLQQRLVGRILYEDDWLLVLDKPAGMAVHGGTGLQAGVIELLRQMRPDARHLELVHRLDRDTSGCLMISRKRSALRVLHQQFRGDDISKTYIALLDGVWRKASQTVDAPLQKNVLQSGERMVRVHRDGKHAVTLFRNLECFADSTLVEASPVTGRTHQIRVHAQHMGYPLLGDERYGREVSNRLYRERALKRLFLHAASLSFVHPSSHERISVQAPLAEDLQKVLEQMRRLPVNRK